VKEWQVLLSGSGGQGLGLAGKILAEAALYRGLYAAHSQSYGARARGGYSDSGVVIGSESIIFPLVETPNLLLTLSREAYDKNVHRLAPRGILIFDADAVNAGPAERRHGFAMTRAARQLGNEKGVALLGLGVITALLGIVRPEDVEKAIAGNLPPGLLEPNLRCYRRGLEMAGGG